MSWRRLSVQKRGVYDLGTFFDRIWELSLFAIPVILLLAAFSGRLGRRYGAHWRYVLWIVLAIRLCLPVQLLPSVPLTTGMRVELPSVRTETRQLLQEQTPMQTITEPIPVPTEQQMLVPTDVPTEAVNPDANSSEQNPLAFFLAYPEWLWGLGVGLFLLWQGWKYAAFQRYLRQNRQRVPDAAALDVYYGLCREMNIANRPALYCCEGLPSPLCIGFFRPTIYLNAQEQGEGELRLILKHELTHCKRGDLWLKGLLMLMRGLHFFNPFVHWMARLVERDMEFSCDLAVMKDCDLQERERYSMTILETIRQSKRKPMRMSTAFSAGKEGLKARIENIFDTSAKKRGVAAFLAVLLMQDCGMVFIGCATEQTQEESAAAVVYGAYTEDIVQQLYAAKLDYIGDASGVGSILELLPCPDGVPRSSEGMELFTTEGEPYGARVYFSDFTQTNDEGWFPIHAMIFLALVDNADFLEYTHRDGNETVSVRMDREALQTYFGEKDVRDFAADADTFRAFVRAINRYFYEESDAGNAEERMDALLAEESSAADAGITGETLLYQMLEASRLVEEIAAQPLTSSNPLDYMDCAEYEQLVAIGEPALMRFLSEFAQGYIGDDLYSYIIKYACQDILGEERTDGTPQEWYRTYIALDSLMMPPFTVEAAAYTEDLRKQYSMGGALAFGNDWSIVAANTDARIRAVYDAMQQRYEEKYGSRTRVLRIYAPDIHKIAEQGDQMQVYLTAAVQDYAFIRTKQGYAFVECGGSTIPARMDFVQENGEWKLTNWVEAQDGSRYADSIREMCRTHPLTGQKMLMDTSGSIQLERQNLLYYMKAYYDGMGIPIYISSYTDEQELARLNRVIRVIPLYE